MTLKSSLHRVYIISAIQKNRSRTPTSSSTSSAQTVRSENGQPRNNGPDNTQYSENGQSHENGLTLDKDQFLKNNASVDKESELIPVREDSPRSVKSIRTGSARSASAKSEAQIKISPQESARVEKMIEDGDDHQISQIRRDSVHKLQLQLAQAIGLASDRSVSLMQCELRVTELQVINIITLCPRYSSSVSFKTLTYFFQTVFNTTIPTISRLLLDRLS